MTKNQKWGIALIISPFILMVTVLVLQVVVRFALVGVVAGGGGPSVISSIVNVVSLIIGLIVTIGFLPAIITGIVLLATGGRKPAAPVVNTPTEPTQRGQ